MLKSLLFCLIVFCSLSTLEAACPFCIATAQTLRQDMASMDVVSFGELVPNLNPSPDQTNGEISGIAEFKLVEVLRGAKILPVGAVVSAPYYGSAKTNGRFLLMGVQQTEVLWSSPLPVTVAAEKYLSAASRLPEERSERLKFYIDFLENPEPLLARDAYEEFAQTPYEDVKAIRDSLSRLKLIEWIKSQEVAPDRKRLYYTLLGICAEKSDSLFLESMLKSKDDSTRVGLDALVACYLTLVGESGLPLVEDLFLKNTKASYPDTFASVMALRFHGTEGGVIDRQKIVASMRWMLERPDFADLVIPDLARWEDWTQIDRLSKLFREADDSSSWVRVPVVNYLRACPLPEAKVALVELEKIDPKAVKRAATFFPIPQPAAAPPQPAAAPPQPAAAPPQPAAAPPQPAAGLMKTEPIVLATGFDSATIRPIASETSSIFIGTDTLPMAVMRVPLGARSPFAFRSSADRARYAISQHRGSSGRQFALSGEPMPTTESSTASTASPYVFPDFVLGDAVAATSSKPMELFATAVLSTTTLLMFMWMILASRPDMKPTLVQRAWASTHRWTHGTAR